MLCSTECIHYVYTLDLPPTHSNSHDCYIFVGNPCKPLFVTVTGWEVDRIYTQVYRYISWYVIIYTVCYTIQNTNTFNICDDLYVWFEFWMFAILSRYPYELCISCAAVSIDMFIYVPHFYLHASGDMAKWQTLGDVGQYSMEFWIQLLCAISLQAVHPSSPCWFKLCGSQLQAVRVEWGNVTMCCTQLLVGKCRTKNKAGELLQFLLECNFEASWSDDFDIDVLGEMHILWNIRDIRPVRILDQQSVKALSLLSLHLPISLQMPGLLPRWEKVCTGPQRNSRDGLSRSRFQCR